MAPIRAQAVAGMIRTAQSSSSAKALPTTSLRWKSSLTTSPLPSTASTASGPKPDYAAPVDKATSTFTPVPRDHLQDGSGSESLPAGLISGAPMELQARTVRIFKPSKPASQSGDWHSHHWKMDWDALSKGHRWENPLMGWQSSGDAMQGTHVNFHSKEDAIAFAEKQGYQYFVQEPNSRRFTPKAYANNFNYSPNKLKYIRTK